MIQLRARPASLVGNRPSKKSGWSCWGSSFVGGRRGEEVLLDEAPGGGGVATNEGWKGKMGRSDHRGRHEGRGIILQGSCPPRVRRVLAEDWGEGRAGDLYEFRWRRRLRVIVLTRWSALLCRRPSRLSAFRNSEVDLALLSRASAVLPLIDEVLGEGIDGLPRVWRSTSVRVQPAVPPKRTSRLPCQSPRPAFRKKERVDRRTGARPGSGASSGRSWTAGERAEEGRARASDGAEPG